MSPRPSLWARTASRWAPPRWWPWSACRCHQCEFGRGCVRGIATTDPELVNMMTVEWGENRVSNLYASWTWQLKEILRRLGMKSIRELVGRTDTLIHLDYYNLPVDDDLRRGA